MAHDTSLVATIVVGLVLAFLFGTLANRLRISPLVGYLLAGVAVGPFTPGFVADQNLAAQLAEIGVILLMFGVGLHFSLKDLLSVRAIAVPGAIAQICVATLLGLGLALWLGWGVGAGIVLGLTLSVASTVVLLRAMQERRLLDTERGHIAVGWLIVEDLATVFVLVLLPALADGLKGTGGQSITQIALAVGLTVGKVAVFVAMMLIVGRRVIPAILHYIAHTGSRELFRLAVLAIALGVAFIAAELFGVSFALGAFFAGMVLNESELSQRAAEESLPLRDAFAVLFFVSVGMLFDPDAILRAPMALIFTLLIILAGKSLAAFAIVRLFGHPTSTALTISASLAQIGEFSFILVDLGIGLNILPPPARDLVLGAAILTILANPILFIGLEKLKSWIEEREAADGTIAAVPPEPAEEELRPTTLRDHAVLVGFGRVGGLVGERLKQSGWPLLVIEDAAEAVERLHRLGIELIQGNAAEDRVLAAANLAQARILLIAIPNAFEAGQIVKQARAANPGLEIVARAHFDAEVDHLTQFGANTVIMGEREIALAMLVHAQQLPGSAASAG